MNEVRGYDSQIDCSDLFCSKCNVNLEPKQVQLQYLSHSFNVTVPCCPVCGQRYIPEDLVRGKMTEVETLLEDK